MKTPQQLLNHAAFISRWSGKPFVWGKTDCMQFLFAWHDFVYKTKMHSKIKNEYSSQREAVRFWNGYPLTTTQWMTLNKFELCENYYHKEGDIMLATSIYPQAFIYHNGAWWSPKEDDEFRSYVDVSGEHNQKWRKI